MANIRFNLTEKMITTANASKDTGTPYALCVYCPAMGVTCDGPNLFSMSIERWVTWINLLAGQRGMSRADIADASNVALSTVNHILSGRTTDPRHSTMQDISAAVVGGCWGKYPCHLASILLEGDYASIDNDNINMIALQTEVDNLRTLLDTSNTNIEELVEERFRTRVLEIQAADKEREKHIADLQKDKKRLLWIIAALAAVLVGIVLFKL